MKVRIYWNKSVNENAAFYYEKAKAINKKIEGGMKALEKLSNKKVKKKVIKVVEVGKEPEWFMNYGWSFTSKGKLILFGRNEKENTKLVKKMRDNDLWFHADIKGGSSVILKEGKLADEDEKREAAVIAVAYSKYFSQGSFLGRAYALGKEGIKNVVRGRIYMKGEREWYEVPTTFYVGIYKSYPMISAHRNTVKVGVGRLSKDEAALKILSMLGLPLSLESYMKSLLPTGSFSIEEV